MYNYNKELKNNARKLRKKKTHSEKIFWFVVKNKKVNGLKFYRQFPFGPYIYDFYCAEKKLFIELDGETHLEEEVVLNDKRKEQFAKSNGFNLIRFADEEIESSMNLVLQKLQDFIKDI